LLKFTQANVRSDYKLLLTTIFLYHHSSLPYSFLQTPYHYFSSALSLEVFSTGRTSHPSDSVQTMAKLSNNSRLNICGMARRTTCRHWYCKFGDKQLEDLTRSRGLGSTRAVLIQALISQDKSEAERPFRFLSLPRELRDMIYFHALVSHVILPPPGYPRWLADQEPPAFTQVSKQVRKESLAVYWGKTTFQLDTFPTCGDSGGPAVTDRHVMLSGGPYRVLLDMFTHSHLVRRLAVLMRFRLKNTHAVIPNPLVACSLTISRNMGSLPQYRVGAELSYFNWPITREEVERLGTHLARSAFLIVNDSQVLFDYSKEGVSRFLSKMPIWIDFNNLRLVDSSNGP